MKPAMFSVRRLSGKVLILSGTMLVFQLVFATGLPDLPEAFDAGWKGKKTCELLYETESVRVGQCSFPPGPAWPLCPLVGLKPGFSHFC